MNILIRRALADDAATIALIGHAAVEMSHRGSCSEKDMNHFLDAHYNEATIRSELQAPEHIYNILLCDGIAAGFSKIVFNAAHERLGSADFTKLDRIYLKSDFFDRKLGHRLLQHNIGLSRKQGQKGMWLFTWQGNDRAVNFYKRNGFSIIGEHRFRITDQHYNQHYQMLLPYNT